MDEVCIAHNLKKKKVKRNTPQPTASQGCEYLKLS